MSKMYLQSTWRQGIVLGLLVVLTPLVAACGSGTRENYSRLPGDTKYVDAMRFKALGCDDAFTVCVDVCTGRSLAKNSLSVQEGEQVRIRFVGKSSCKRTALTCTAQNVHSRNEGLSYDPQPASSAQSANTTAKQSVQQAKTIATTLSMANTSMSAAAMLSAISSTISAPPKTQRQARNEKHSPPASSASSSLQWDKNALRHKYEHATNAATHINTILASSESLDLHPRALEAYTDLDHYQQALQSVLQDDTNAITPQQMAALEVQARQAVKTVYTTSKAQLETKTATANKLEKSTRDDAQKEMVFGDCVIETSTTPLNVREVTVDAHLGAPLVSTPVGTSGGSSGQSGASGSSGSSREGAGGASGQAGGSSGSSGQANAGSSGQANAGSSGQTDADGGSSGQADTDGGAGGASFNESFGEEDAFIIIDIDHGKYFYDVGLLTAIVPDGKRAISAIQRAQQPGDMVISLSQQETTTAAIAVNFYPAGHRRGMFSPFESGPTKRRIAWGDLFGFQAAFSPNLANPAQTVFGGLLIEPVT